MGYTLYLLEDANEAELEYIPQEISKKKPEDLVSLNMKLYESVKIGKKYESVKFGKKNVYQNMSSSQES